MQKLLPASALSWTQSEQPKVYSGREIFQYMDGAGEVYLAYGFQRLLTQRYAKTEQEEILVEIFDMGAARNAFGAFTSIKGHGTPVDIGQGGEYKSGLLAFWRGRYFVCVIIERENSEATKTVHQIAASIARSISETGPTPEILNILPQDEILPQTLVYLYRHEILNIHYHVADKNLFHLGDKTDAVLVRMKSNKSYLLLIKYLTEHEAEAAFVDFTSSYMPESNAEGVVQTENKKWTACRRDRTLLTVVFDAPTNAEAQALLDTVHRRDQ